MNCSTCQTMLPDYGAGTLPRDERREVQFHLVACAGCRAHLAADETLLAVLAATPLRQPPAGFTAAVLARVQPHRQPQPAVAAWLAPAAAALSVLAFAVGVRRLLGALAWNLMLTTWLRQAATALDGARAGSGWLPAWPPALSGGTPDPIWLVAAVLTVTAVWGAWWALARA